MGLKYSDAPLVSALTGSEVWGVTQAGSSRRLPLDLASNWGKRVTITNSSYTISDQGISVLEVNIGTSTITLPDLATWSGRTIIIRKINSTAGTITISRASSDTITRADLVSVTLTSEGDYWELYAASDQWEITSGIEREVSGSDFFIGFPSGEAVNSVTFALNATVVSGNVNQSDPVQNGNWVREFINLDSASFAIVQSTTLFFGAKFGLSNTGYVGLRAFSAAVETAGVNINLRSYGRWYA